MDSLIILLGKLTAPDSGLTLPTNLRQAILDAIAAHQSGNPLPETAVRSLIDPLNAIILEAEWEYPSSDELDDYFDNGAASAAGPVVSESENSESEEEKK